ncbi:hypothetical protein F4778DRAFT_352077 [Xylariomycetidae sp. FL2044]|nr:hypothetical protein F4778DRAFT_352077 [Xylariomycetidae sp. FL2044]
MAPSRKRKSTTRPLTDLDTNKANPIFPPSFVAEFAAKGIISTNENSIVASRDSSGKATSQDAATPPSEPSPPTTKKPTTRRSTKRKSDAVEEPDEDLPEISDDDPRLDVIDQTCGQIRNKIRRFIDSGAMKVGEFQKALVVLPGSYQRFMNQIGPDAGASSTTYVRAHRFFKKRELQGLRAVPPKKRGKKGPGGEDSANPIPDVSDIHLEGEDKVQVPVYDTCDDVRGKVRTFLRQHPKITQAGFLREICKTYPSPRGISATQFSTYMSKKRNPVAGNTCALFYAGYVFFEKLRIKEGKPKTEKRLEMEEIYKPGHPHGSEDGRPGINTTRRLDGPIWLKDTERAWTDKYGVLQIEQR